MLWSLPVSAGDLQTSEKLTRLCTIPEPVTRRGLGTGTAYAMEARTVANLFGPALFPQTFCALKVAHGRR